MKNDDILKFKIRFFKMVDGNQVKKKSIIVHVAKPTDAVEIAERKMKDKYCSYTFELRKRGL